VLAALTACGTTQVDRFTVDVPPGASYLGMDVRNELGGVEIRVDPTAERIRVETVKHVPRTVAKEQRAAVLERIDVYPDLEAPPSRRGVVHLTVEGRNGEAPGERSADLFVVTPRCDGVRVQAAGDVLLVGVGGAIEVENERGAVDVRTARPVAEPVALITGAGNVYLQIPPESVAEFDLQAPQGRARFRSMLAPLVAATYTPHRVIGVLNDGDNPVLLRSGDGDVAVIVIENPEALVR